MHRKWKWPLFVLVLILAGTAWVVQQRLQPRHFVLQVVNLSGNTVDRVRLFGTALQQDALLLQLPSGQSADIEAELGNSGTLRFEVTQGLNHIDTFIVDDVRKLEHFLQRLTIRDHNRFLLGDPDTPPE